MKLKIKRFINDRNYFDEYDIDFKEDETILELLDRVRNKDRTLTYRSFCRSSICGTCAIRVNGKTILACKSKVKNLIENNSLVIEPVNRVKVIKDLVVDNSFIEEKINKVNGWFVDKIDETKENLQTPEKLKKYDKQTDCILCGACFYECDALDYEQDYAGPFAFTKVFRFVFDSRDKMDKQQRIEIAKKNFLYSCVNCQKCALVCPKGISSMMDIKMLQLEDKNPPFNENNLFF